MELRWTVCKQAFRKQIREPDECPMCFLISPSRMITVQCHCFILFYCVLLLGLVGLGVLLMEPLAFTCLLLAAGTLRPSLGPVKKDA